MAQWTSTNHFPTAKGLAEAAADRRRVAYAVVKDARNGRFLVVTAAQARIWDRIAAERRRYWIETIVEPAGEPRNRPPHPHSRGDRLGIAARLTRRNGRRRYRGR